MLNRTCARKCAAEPPSVGPIRRSGQMGWVRTDIPVAASSLPHPERGILVPGVVMQTACIPMECQLVLEYGRIPAEVDSIEYTVD